MKRQTLAWIGMVGFAIHLSLFAHAHESLDDNSYSGIENENDHELNDVVEHTIPINGRSAELDGFVYTFEEGVLSIDGEGTFGSGISGVPEVMANHLNMGGRTGVQKLIIGSGITGIGNWAFHDYVNLTEVCLSDTVKSIGSNTFYNCTKLESVNLPESVEVLDDAFRGCVSLATIDLPNGTIVGHHAFSGCSALNPLRIGTNVQIKYGAFEGCEGITELSIPDDLLWEAEAFSNCTGLRKVVIHDGVEKIPQRAFKGCTGLMNIQLHEGMHIGLGAFEGDTSIREIILPENCVVDAESFKDCLLLKHIIIPASTEITGSRIFSGCISLTTAGPIGGDYCIEYGMETSIPYGLFEGSGLLTIDFHDRIELIEGNAFYGSRIEEVVLPESIKSIGYQAFSNCSHLRHLVIQSTEDMQFTLKNTPKLTSVGPIGSGASIEYGWEDTIPDKVFYGSCIEQIEFSPSIRSIGNTAFGHCDSLKKVVIPGGIRDIGPGAFNWCGNLESFTLCEGITRVDNSFLGSCKKLSKIFVPKSLKGDFNYIFGYYGYNDMYYTVICDKDSDAYKWGISFGKEVMTPQEAANAIFALYNASYPKDMASIVVFDRDTMDVVDNATIIIDEHEYNTAQQVSIALGADTENKMVQVAAEGYYPIYKNVELVRGKTVYLSMVPKGQSNLAILSVQAAYESKITDLLNGTLRMAYVPDIDKNNAFVEQLGIIVDAEGAQKYELLSDGQVIQTNTDGRFSLDIINKVGTTNYDRQLVTTDIVNASKLSVRVSGESAVAQVEQPLGVKITRNYISAELEKQKGKLKLGDGLSIDIPEDVPLIGGDTYKIGFAEKMPFDMSIDEDGIVRFAINKSVDKPLEKYAEEYKNLEKHAKNVSDAVKAFGGSSQPFGAGFVSLDGKIYGYGEGNISELDQGKLVLSVGVIAEITGKAGYKQYFMAGFVPVSLSVEGKVGASIEAKASITVDNYRFTNFKLVDGKIQLKGELTAGAGVGLELLTALKVSVTGSVNYVYKPQREYQKLWLSASGKISQVSLCIFEHVYWKSKNYKITLFETGTDKLNKTSSAASYNMESVDVGIFDANEELIPADQILNRDYLQYDGYGAYERTTQNDSESGVDSVSKTVVKSAVLPSTDVKVIWVGGKYYMFWLDDVPERTDMNRAAMFYATSLNGNDWSEPKRVVDETKDPTMDYGFDITSFGDDIIIVWQDAKSLYDDDSTEDDLATDIVMRAALLDTASDSTEIVDSDLTGDNGYYMYPAVYETDDETVVACIQDTYGSETSEPVLVIGEYRDDGIRQTSNVSFPEGTKITNMQLFGQNGGVFAVCDMDTDGDLLTAEDKEIAVVNVEDGVIHNLTDNEIADGASVVGRNGEIYWLSADGLMRSEDYSEAAECVSGDLNAENISTFSIGEIGGTKCVFFESYSEDDNKPGIYILRQEGDDGFSAPIRITDISGNITSKLFVNSPDGTTLVCGVEGDFLEDGTLLQDLCVYRVGDMTDVSIGQVTYDQEEVTPNTTIPLTIWVTNNGTTPVDSVELVVDGSSAGIYGDLDLQPGQSTELSYESFVIPESLTDVEEHTITVSVDGDQNARNDSTSFIIGYTDLAVESTTRLSDDHYWIDSTVTNDSMVASSGQIRIHKGSPEGEVIYETSFEEIAQDEVFTATYYLESYDEEEVRFYVEVISDKEESFLGNNEVFVYTGYGSGIEASAEVNSKELQADTVTIIGDRGIVSDQEITMIGNDENRNAIVLEAQASKSGSSDGISQIFAWSSSNPEVASVSEGLITAKSNGRTTITAMATDGSGISDSCTVIVKAYADEVKITGPQQVAPGKKVALQAELAVTCAEDGTSFTVSDPTVTWNSGAPAIARIDPKTGVITAVKAGLAMITATANDEWHNHATFEITVTEKIPQKVQIYRDSTDGESIGNRKVVLEIDDNGIRDRLDAYAACTYRSGTVDLTTGVSQTVNWVCGDTGVAEIINKDDGGITIHAISNGETSISAIATDGSGVKNSFTLIVGKQVRNIEIDGADSVAVGKTIMLNAATSPEDADVQSVIWSSEDEIIAKVDASGKVTGRKAGTVTIKAKATDGSGVVGEKSIRVTAPVQKITIRNGDTVVTGTKISLDPHDETKKSVALNTVSEVLKADKKTWTIEGVAQGVSWKTSNGNVATVSVDGIVMALTNGTATITATATDGSNKSATVTVQASTLMKDMTITGPSSVATKKSIVLKAEAIPAGTSNKAVTWKSENEQIAKVDANGRVTGIAKGTTGITATAKDGSGASESKEILVTIATEQVCIKKETQVVTNSILGLDLDETTTLNLSAENTAANAALEDVDQRVIWKSANPRVATVDENGLVTAVGTGSTQITATAQDGSNKSGRVTINVARLVQGITLSGETRVGVGKNTALTAKITPDSATNKNLIWSVSDTAKASVANGRVTIKPAAAAGDTVTVTAMAKDGSGVSGTYDITVVPLVDRISIRKDGADVTKQTITQDLSVHSEIELTAVCTGKNPADEVSDAVTWKSSNTKVAVVDAGTVTLLAPGTATITATAADGSNKNATVSVKATQSEIIITGPAEVAAGKSVKLAAAGPAVTWSIAELDPAVSDARAVTIAASGSLTVKNTVAPDTVITVLATENAKNKAENEKKKQTYTVTVKKPAAAVKILRQSDASDVTGGIIGVDRDALVPVALGVEVSDTTLGTASVSQLVTWKSANTRVAVVGADGIVHPVGAGTARITATTLDGTNKSASVTINVASLTQSIRLTAAGNATMVAQGKALQFTAVAAPYRTANKTFVWRCEADYSEVGDAASIPANLPKNAITVTTTGRVTVNAGVPAKTKIRVFAAAKDGSGVESAGYTVTVTKPAARIDLFVAGEESGAGAADRALTGKKYGMDRDAIGATVSLTALAGGQTAYDGITAGISQEVIWSTTNAKVAVVSPAGVVTSVGAGTAQIKATSADGTNKMGSVTINVASLVTGIAIAGPSAIAGGKASTAKYTVTVTPDKAADKKVTWSAVYQLPAGSNVTIKPADIRIGNGTLSISKTVPVGTKITVTATAADGSRKSADKVVTVE